MEKTSAIDLPHSSCNFPYRSRTSHHSDSLIFISLHIFTARKRSLGQGNIFAPVCHSVHRRGAWAGTPLGRYTPQAGTPPGKVHNPGRYTPQAGTPPPGRYMPPGRYTPYPRQVYPWAGIPPDRYTPLWQVHPPAGTPPGRYTPLAGTPLEQCMLGDTGNKRAVRILLECILVLLANKKLFWTNFDYNRSRFLLAHALPLTKKKRCTKYFAWEIAPALLAFYNNMVIYDFCDVDIAHVCDYAQTIRSITCDTVHGHCFIPHTQRAWFIKHWKLSLHDRYFQARLIEIDTCECGSQLPILSLYEAHGKSRLKRTELRGLHTSFLTKR